MRPSPGAGAGADTPTGGTMEKASKCVQGWGGVGRGGDCQRRRRKRGTNVMIQEIEIKVCLLVVLTHPFSTHMKTEPRNKYINLPPERKVFNPRTIFTLHISAQFPCARC